MDDRDRPEDERSWAGEGDDLERASENVLGGWPSDSVEDRDGSAPEPGSGAGPVETRVAEDAPAAAEDVDGEPDAAQAVAAEEAVVETERDDVPASAESSAEHAPGELSIPPGYPVLEGEPRGGRRAVGIVVSRFNGHVTRRLLESALDELSAAGVERGSITVMPVPGAFELPIAAMALAKTRRFACVVALGCVIRGDTPHFDYVASEAASGLQLAAIETGVPVAFGVLTLDRPDQAAPRVDKGAEAVRTALEMADLFANLRAAAAR
ncbi:MAG TPA: 6,7-dimethyl-8-ribityllumazine synthase [Gaiella sp.]|uniref:6,7-dimethyl-8-ribityllumazine synthase n=1 Tax=Gaiella sp. TaxID=2663207 RepID=UPI002D7F2410|nr:6,7-dimethyl-8-ribityllumazine synthase [Gaiella sp.]HET9287666.1 6,7-dimethyl-8-ribityllumazine synthase [Gaiella sp.]